MSTSPKVLILATSPQTKGGVTAVISAYQRTSLWRDWQCKWLSTHIDRVWYIKIWFFIKSYFSFVFLLPHFDLIHIHLSEPASLFRKSVFFMTAKLFRKKIILHFHSFANEKTTAGKFRRFYKYIFKQADLILVLSNSTKRILQVFVDNSVRIEVLNNPADIRNPDKVAVELLSPSKPYILFAGSMTAAKGYADLVHAFIDLASDFPDWKLILAGGDPDISISALIADRNLRDRIIFPGWLRGQAKDTIFRAATIFCLPSYQEGLPMAVLDAMVAGVPVITNPVGSLPDFFTDEVHLLYSLPGDNLLLKSQLLRLIQSPDLRKKLSACATDLIIEKFDIKKLHLQLADFYKSTLEVKS